MRNLTSPIASEGFCKPMYFEENMATKNVYARNPSHVIGITKKSSKQELKRVIKTSSKS